MAYRRDAGQDAGRRREQLDALQISMEAEARRADAAGAERSRLYDKMEGIMRTREGLIDALAEAQRKREQVIFTGSGI